MRKWQKVFETGSPVRAEIVKGVLEEKGILAIIVNKKESVYQIHGNLEVMVPESQTLIAINIVKDEITF
ncbi:putative signal transducing protein [Pararhodonellum marinum]|uniref:putative signal transducing protein n=1 Tax=Pararhodonellum marinum TaxID=2755358 RepID=UPI00188FC386|nr:DUF2007 domain-containing protein [Pararhodonellum marinum]